MPNELRFLYDAINSLRQQKGRQRCFLDFALEAAARAHAEDMAKNNFYSHIGSNGSSPAERIQLCGCTKPYSAELLSAVKKRNDPEQIVNGWYRSWMTRIQLMGRDNAYFGAAFARCELNQVWYWVIDFGKREAEHESGSSLN